MKMIAFDVLAIEKKLENAVPFRVSSLQYILYQIDPLESLK
jgi:hypothetical protein